MLQSHFTIALRNLYKHKFHSAISLFGLLTAISSSLVLILYAYQELTFDAYHPDAQNTYLIYKERLGSTGQQVIYDTWAPMLDALRDEYPSIKVGARAFSEPGIVKVGTNRFSQDILFADPELFHLFDLPLETGEGAQILQTKAHILISKQMAGKLLGREDAVGENIRVRTLGVEFDFIVGGVFSEIPANSSVRPDIIVSFANIENLDIIKQAGWNMSFLRTYVQLSGSENQNNLESVFPSFVRKYFDDETANQMKLKLASIPELHDLMTGSSQAVSVMLCVALIIIVIAVVNYINIASVRSMERSKEIALRKVMGASSKGLLIQFLSEALILTAISFVGAGLFLQVLMPFINSSLGTSLSLSLILNPALLSGLFGLFFLIAVASGIMPVFFIATNAIVELVKGKMKSSAVGIAVKRGLILLQFTLSIILLFSTIVIYRQVNFLRDHDTGSDKKNIVVIRTDTENLDEPEAALRKVAVLKEKLLQHSKVTAVATSNIVPSDQHRAGYILVRPEGWQDENPLRIRRATVDAEYFALYNIRFVQGRNFYNMIASNDSTVHAFAIINEKAMRAFGWTDAIGKKISEGVEVVGVVENHHYASLAEAVEPMVFIFRLPEEQRNAFLSIKLEGSPTNMLPLLEQSWKSMDASAVFSYFFVDKNFDNLYRVEERNIKIITWFSCLAIIIASVGLLGLISFTVNHKFKEIGIRKALGASKSAIVLLLNREFIILILVATTLALPMAWYLMNLWLSGFALRIDIHWDIYFVVAIMTFVLVIATTSGRILYAVRINPVIALRMD